MTNYTIGIISVSGFPFKEIILRDELPKSDLHLRFFDLSTIERNEKPEHSFELQAGLISALTEFSRLVGQSIKYLRYKGIEEEESYIKIIDKKKIINNKFFPIVIEPESNLIVTVKSERFTSHEALEAKVNIIYDEILKKKMPLNIETQDLTSEEIDFIIAIMNDSDARENLEINYKVLKKAFEQFLEDLESYGLLSIVITSFDNTPLVSFGISMEDTFKLFRDMASIPKVGTYQWKYRTGKINKNGTINQYWVYIIGTGSGIVVKNHVQKYKIFLICSPASFLGEIPERIYLRFDEIMG